MAEPSAVGDQESVGPRADGDERTLRHDVPRRRLVADMAGASGVRLYDAGFALDAASTAS